jgi:hypothetical protein
MLLLPTLMNSATPAAAETSAIGAAGEALVPESLPTSTDVRGPPPPVPPLPLPQQPKKRRKVEPRKCGFCGIATTPAHTVTTCPKRKTDGISIDDAKASLAMHKKAKKTRKSAGSSSKTGPAAKRARYTSEELQDADIARCVPPFLLFGGHFLDVCSLLVS